MIKIICVLRDLCKNLFVFLLVFSCSSLFAQWTSTNLSVAKEKIAVASMGDEVFFIGGNKGANGPDTNIVEIYNSSTDEWRTEEFSFYSGADLTTVQTENYLISFDNVGKIHLYNKQSKSWETIDHPNRRSGYAAVTHNDKVYFAGGKKSFEPASKVVDIYNLMTKEWSVDSLSAGRSDITTAVVDDKIFFLGGDPKAGFTNSDVVDVLNTNTGEWENFTLTEGKYDMGLVVVEDKIILAGGQLDNSLSSGFSDLVEIIDTETYNIQTLFLSNENRKLQGIRLDNKAIFVGGETTIAEIVDIAEMTVNSSILSSATSLFRVKATVLGNKAYFSAGTGINGALVFIYDGDTELWTNYKYGDSRQYISMISHKDKLFIAGGRKADFEMTDEVFIYQDTSIVVSNLQPFELPQINIYPNPSSNFLHIEIKESVEGLSASLYGINGDLLFETDFPKLERTMQIDLREIHGKVFLLKLTSKNETYTYKVYKQ